MREPQPALARDDETAAASEPSPLTRDDEAATRNPSPVRDSATAHDQDPSPARDTATPRDRDPSPARDTATARGQDPSPARDEEAVRHFVERVALLFSDWGFPRMAARVLFALMTADEPGLSAPELAARLDVSPAAVSGAVRYLGQISLIQRQGVPGSRRDLYRLPDRTWYTSTATAVQFYGLLIAAAEDALAPLGGADTTAGARVAEMRDFFTFMRAAMPGLLDQWEASRRPGAGSPAESPSGD